VRPRAGLDALALPLPGIEPCHPTRSLITIFRVSLTFNYRYNGPFWVCGWKIRPSDRKVNANILNDEARKADKKWSFSLS
jgi:hypothetical protein